MRQVVPSQYVPLLLQQQPYRQHQRFKINKPRKVQALQRQNNALLHNEIVHMRENNFFSFSFLTRVNFNVFLYVSYIILMLLCAYHHALRLNSEFVQLQIALEPQLTSYKFGYVCMIICLHIYLHTSFITVSDNLETVNIKKHDSAYYITTDGNVK